MPNKQVVLFLIGAVAFHSVSWGQAYDARINQVITVTLNNGGTILLGAGGRVGNWVYSAGTGGLIVFDIDVAVGNPNHYTSLYTATMPTTFTGLILTLNASPLLSGVTIYSPGPPMNGYVGNGWICGAATSYFSRPRRVPAGRLRTDLGLAPITMFGFTKRRVTPHSLSRM